MEMTTGQLISYDVIQGDEGGELVLLRSEQPAFLEESAVSVGLPLCDGLQAIAFTYFNDDGEPYESWDSDSEEFDGALPLMVSVAFEFLNTENSDAPITFMTSVTLPANYIPEPLQNHTDDDDDTKDTDNDDTKDTTPSSASD
jgi:hypothetical protein